MNKLSLVASLVVGLSASAFAADWYVSSDGLYGTEEGADETHRKKSIQEAIDAAKADDTVWVKDGYVCNSGKSPINNNYGYARINLNKAITLRSESGSWEGGATITGEVDPSTGGNGTDAVRAIHVNGSAKIVGFCIKDAAAGGSYGGAVVFASGNGPIEKCFISGCKTTGILKPAFFKSYVTVTDCVCSNNAGGLSWCRASGCTIVRNTATSGAGGCGSCVLNDCEIVGNITTNLGSTSSYCRGGGIADCTATNCLIAGNAAYNGIVGSQYAGGGGAYTSTLVDCVVSNNYCQSDGGGCGGCSIYDSMVVGNEAKGNGGGASGGNVVISNTVFLANTAKSAGGGLYQSSGLADVREVDFIGNSAGSYGGGTRVIEIGTIAGKANFADCTFVGNVAESGGGGGLMGDGASNVQATGCVFSNNVVKSAAVYAGGGGVCNVKLDASLVTSNAVYALQSNAYGGGGGCNLKATDCVVSNNYCKSSGGGLSGVCTLAGCTVVGNESRGNGGGARLYANSVITNCVLSGNLSAGSGGGLYTVAGVLIYDSHFDGNTVEAGYGGGVYAENTTVKLVRCSVSSNVLASAGDGQGGGGIYSGTLEKCTIKGNTIAAKTGFSEKGGGGTHSSDLDGCTVDGNWCANGCHGGGVYKGTVRNSIVINNTLEAFSSGWTSNGGGIYSATAYNCVISNNTACMNGGGVSGTICYNCLIVGNVQGGPNNSGAACNGGSLYNCTVTGNNSKNNSILGCVDVINCIVYDNKPNTATATGVVSNNCVSVAITGAAQEGGNIVADPKFRATEGETAFRLKGTSPCKRAGLVMGWMAKPEDPRSRDLAGIAWGDTPSIGCYSYCPIVGLLLLLR